VEEQGKLTNVPLLLHAGSRDLSPRTRTVRRRRGFVLLAFIFAVFSGPRHALDAQQSKPEEYQVKAVYLFNFGKFIEWPQGTPKDNLFGVCVLGHDPFGATLDATINGEIIEGKKLVARRIAGIQDAANCRILFIGMSEANHVKQILASVERTGVLTVSDMPDFTSSGGMIQFVLRENKVRFEVNLSAAEKAGLTFSSQLLKVATTVKRDEQKGVEVQ
jgi:hypothetical protein